MVFELLGINSTYVKCFNMADDLNFFKYKLTITYYYKHRDFPCYTENR